MSGVTTAISLARARLRHRPARGLLVALAVTLVVGVEVASAGVSRMAGDEALRAGLADVPAGYRSIVVSASGFLSEPAALARRGDLVRQILRPVSAAPPRALTLFQPLADAAGATFSLAGVDDLPTAVTVLTGRLPAPCTPTRCEVVQVGPEAAPRLDPSLGVVVVGTAIMRDRSVLSGSYQPTDHAPVLIGDGSRGMDSLASLPTFGRSNGWVAAVNDAALTITGVGPELARLAALRSALALADRGLYLTAPDEQLAIAAARSDTAARRLLLVGAGAVALAAAFALLAAIGLARDHQAAARLLSRRGAGRAAIAAFHLAEAMPSVVLGATGGLLLGAVAVDRIARHESLGAGYPSQAIGDALATVLITGSLVLGVIVLVLARLATERVPGKLPLALVGVGLAAVTFLAARRGAVAPSRLAATDDPLLAFLPTLAATTAALLAAIAGPPILTLVERALGQRALVVRLALLAVVRRPLRLTGVAGFVAAAGALALFAVTYAATLHDGARDEAGFRVPFDATIAEGPALILPLEVSSLAGYGHLTPGLTAYGVVRQSANVRSAGHQAVPVALLGVPAGALAAMDSFRPDFATRSRSELARLVAWHDGRYRGPVLPAGTTRISLDLAGEFRRFEASVDLRDGAGVVRVLALDATAGVSVPPTSPGTVLAGITFRVPDHDVARRLHQAGEGVAPAAGREGTFRILALRANGSVVPGLGVPWVVVSGGSLVRSGPGVAVHWVVVAEAVRVRPAQPTDHGIPVIADPATAAAAGADGSVALTVGAGSVLRGIVVGTADRVPGLPSRFVVADVAALSPALDADEPVTGAVREVWLRGPAERALAGPRFAALEITYRRRLVATLAGDPLGRAAVALVAVAGGLAVLLALIAIILGLLGDARDERAELYALETDGLPPRTIRRLLVVRSVMSVAIAAPVGTLAGLLVVRSTAQLIAVTAQATVPEPPLLVAIAWWQPLLAVAGSVVVASVVAVACALPLLRGRLPRRPEGGLG